MTKILIHIIIAVFISVPLYSQSPNGVQDSLAFINIQDPYLIDDNTLEFDLMIRRNSDRWYKLANATFQLEFSTGNEVVNKNDLTVELIDSELEEQLIPGDVLPTTGYYIEQQVFDGRMSITVLGPPKFEDCQLIPEDRYLKLGTFQIKTAPGTKVPTTLQWKEPHHYYQACAFKLAQDSVVEDFIVWYGSDDNVPLEDRLRKWVMYQGDVADSLEFVLKLFDAEYVGRKYISLNIATLAEINNEGFTILRAPKVDPNANPNSLIYTDTVFTFLEGSQYYNPDLIGKGNTKFGHDYEESMDFVPYRGGAYCYALYATFEFQDGSRLDSLVAIDCADVPHAVIAKASPLENPFNLSTVIEYELEDDVMLTVTAYDVLGREIKLLSDDATGNSLNNIEMKRGMHYTTFYAPELASQGLYDIVFIAEPLDDSAFESSVAVVKLQLIKDGTR